MSLLTTIQQAALRVGFVQPNVAASSTDQNILQMVAFASEEGQELARRYPWQAIRYEANFTTTGVESQGDIRTICTAINPQASFNYIYNETIWNRTQRRPIFGPKTPSEWQQLKAQFVQGPWYQFIIRNNAILFTPVPNNTDTCYFEYITDEWCLDNTGTIGQTAWANDADTARISEHLITLGVVWRYRQAKGLEYAAAFDKYEEAVINAMARDGGKPRLTLSGYDTTVYPGTIVPAGNWPL